MRYKWYVSTCQHGDGRPIPDHRSTYNCVRQAPFAASCSRRPCVRRFMPLCHRQFRMQMSETAVRPRSTRITINNDQRANYRSANFFCATSTYLRRKEPTDRPTDLPHPLPSPLPFRLIAASLPGFFHFSSLRARYAHAYTACYVHACMSLRTALIFHELYTYGTLLC